jgi:hypothetical protein
VFLTVNYSHAHPALCGRDLFTTHAHGKTAVTPPQVVRRDCGRAEADLMPWPSNFYLDRARARTQAAAKPISREEYVQGVRDTSEP